jgi:hypothetical protein
MGKASKASNTSGKKKDIKNTPAEPEKLDNIQLTAEADEEFSNGKGVEDDEQQPVG